MAQNDMLKRYLDAGMAFTEMTRKRAEGIVKDLVKAGEVQRDQAQDRVDELLDRSRKNTERMLELVRKEISDQLSSLGLATKDDLAKLEAKLAGSKSSGTTRASGAGKVSGATQTSAPAAAGTPESTGTGTTPAAAKKATSKKATAKKSTAAKKAAG